MDINKNLDGEKLLNTKMDRIFSASGKTFD